jgi:hypothetical protein
MAFQYDKCRREPRRGQGKSRVSILIVTTERTDSESRRRKASPVGGTGSHPSAFPFDDGQVADYRQVRESHKPLGGSGEFFHAGGSNRVSIPAIPRLGRSAAKLSAPHIFDFGTEEQTPKPLEATAA